MIKVTITPNMKALTRTTIMMTVIRNEDYNDKSRNWLTSLYQIECRYAVPVYRWTRDDV